MEKLDGKRFFVYGGGVSGKSAYRAIKKRGGKVKIYKDEDGKFSEPKPAHYDYAIVSPGIRRDHPVYAYCKQNGIKTIGEVELGFSLAECPVIGVTGTNGKTTTTRLIAAMTGGTACGNIGYPITTAVDVENKTLVCELSSFQLKDARISPRVAVITNLAADHLDWHGSEEEYYKCKCNIASYTDGALVLGEDITVGALKNLNTRARLVRCSTTCAVDGAYIEDGYFKFCGERVCPVEYLRLQGRHNLKNALCAVAAAKCMNTPNIDILKAMSTASPDRHRIEYVGTARGKRWIDDSKATNVAACLAALDTVCGSVCLIVGGRDKALDFSELFTSLPENVMQVVAMGESAPCIQKSAEAVGYCGELDVVAGLFDAVRLAADSCAETVLLSPCCASFDEFESYEERGRKFAAAVLALKDGK